MYVPIYEDTAISCNIYKIFETKYFDERLSFLSWHFSLRSTSLYYPSRRNILNVINTVKRSASLPTIRCIIIFCLNTSKPAGFKVIKQIAVIYWVHYAMHEWNDLACYEPSIVVFRRIQIGWTNSSQLVVIKIDNYVKYTIKKHLTSTNCSIVGSIKSAWP